MGILIMDHRQGQGIDDKQGTLQEMDTVNCSHCGALIALLKKGTDTLHLSNVDFGKSIPIAPTISTQYVAKRRCTKCKKGICAYCAERLVRTGVCLSVKARVEIVAKAHETGNWSSPWAQKLLEDEAARVN